MSAPPVLVRSLGRRRLRDDLGRAAGARPSVIIAGSALLLLVVGAAAANLIRPDAFLRTDLTQVLAAPSAAHPIGTDEVGRDLLAMVLRGLRVSFAVSTVAALLTVAVGGTLGIIAGAIGGRVDEALMRIVDFFSSQNHLLFGLLIAVLTRPVVGGAGAVAMAVGFTHWMRLARILRAEVLSLRERPFISNAIGIGATRRQLMTRHFLPHVVPVAAVGFVLMFPHAIFHESALSFLGVGMPPQNPSLGTLIAAGQRALVGGGWWMVVIPGLVIVIAGMAIGTVGDWLRDRTQPRWRGELEL